MKTETLETLANVGSKVTATGAATSVVGTFILQNFTGLLGVVIALIGVLINVHYKRKANKRRDMEFVIDTRLKENQDRRFEEWQKFRMDMARKGVDVPPITDFGALAPAAGPWIEPRKAEEDEDER